MTQVVVLLSAGLHPQSGRPAPVPVELQAIRLALTLAPDPVGLHAGVPDASITECLGHGLARILAVPVSSPDIPAALAMRLRPTSERLFVLAGRRGQGGEDGGLLPYRLAHLLGLPIIPDIIAASAGSNGRLVAEQWRPRGARREVTVAGSAVLTVHPAAPPALPYVHAAARRGTIEPTDAASPPPDPDGEGELRPFRHRPPVTGAAPSSPDASRIVTDATPDEAAALILAHLRALGLLARPSQGTPGPHVGDRPGPRPA